LLRRGVRRLLLQLGAVRFRTDRPSLTIIILLATLVLCPRTGTVSFTGCTGCRTRLSQAWRDTTDEGRPTTDSTGQASAKRQYDEK
jgi:hypothetical protein